MGEVVMRFSYSGQSFNLNIDDTDTLNLSDLLNDMVDEAAKLGKPMPKNPALKYSVKTIVCDSDVVEIVNRFHGKKVIPITVVGTSSPLVCLKAARELRAKQAVEEEILDPVSNNLTQDPVSINLTQDSVSNNLTQDPVSNNLTQDPVSINLTQDPISQVTQSTQLTRFKTPKTTAKKRNTFTPRTRSNTNNLDNITTKRIRREVMDNHVVNNDGVDVGESDSDESFEPSDYDIDDDEAVSDLEDEGNILGQLQFIDDGYVPFNEETWSDNEEEFSSKMLNNGEVYEDKHFGCISLRPWMLFMDADHLKDVVTDYCIQEGFYVIVVKSDSSRYTIECATANCNWRLHASILQDGNTWVIKSITNPTHGCVGVETYNRMASAEWVAKKLLEDIRDNPDIRGDEIQKILQNRYGYQMAKSSVYRMKKLALAEINGGSDESYKMLPAYCEMIKRTNKGSYAICSWKELETPERPIQFTMIFISFAAQFNGLIQGCRSLIGVDGTHLKGSHGGVLLSAVALDGNNELFPIALGVVDSENTVSWANFFYHLKHCLKESKRSNWTIICDRQKVSLIV